MKLKHIIWKRILTYCLVLSMVVSNSNVAFAQTINNSNTEKNAVLDESSQCEESKMESTQNLETTEPELDNPVTGDGTVDNPYILCNASQLEMLRDNLSSYFELACDIDLEGKDWTPVGTYDVPFTGNLNGNGYTISNFVINGTLNYTGFFARTTNAIITDLTLDHFMVTQTGSGTSYTGGLAGIASGSGTRITGCHIKNAVVSGVNYVGGFIGSAKIKTVPVIENCSCDAGVSASGQNAGGFIGFYWGNAKHCTFTGKVTAGDDSGGLFGTYYAGTIEECYSTGDIKSNGYAGGLIGWVSNRTATVKNCFVLGTVTGSKSDYTGAIIGASNYTSTNVSNCYSAAEVTGTSAFMNGSANLPNCYFDSEFTKCINGSSAARLTPAMRSKSNYENWNFETIWTIEEGESYPYLRNLEKPVGTYAGMTDIEGNGSQENPYLIRTADELNLMRGEPTAWYRIENNIDLEGADWTPVGTYDAPFKGNLNGNGYSISNFRINGTSSYTGFFARISNAVITDMMLDNFTVTQTGSGTGYTGGLAGIADGASTKITGCHIKNAVVSGVNYVGGFIGSAKIKTVPVIENCSCDAGVTALGQNAGGFIGYYYGSAKCCAFTGKVTAGDDAGGLFGTYYAGTAEECYSTGDIKSNGYAGGLIGWVSNRTVTVKNCFVLGTVTGSKSDYTGAIIGENYQYQSTSVSNCYSAAEVTGTSAFMNGSVNVSKSYFDSEFTKCINGSNGARLTPAMRSESNYENWDFETVWTIEEGESYPYLRNLEKPAGVYAGTINIEGNGSQENPYLIRTADELNLMRGEPTAWYEIKNDIDLEGADWTPVGTYDVPFTGNLNGNGYSISDFRINGTTSYTGFFARTSNAVITDLTLDHFTVTQTGSDYTGGLAGTASGSSTRITGCHIKNAVVSGVSYVGGFIGYTNLNVGTAIENCSCDAEVTASGQNAGGFVGLYWGSVKRCVFTGKVTAGANAGGLFGTYYAGTAEECYSTGDIKSNGYAGGLIGWVSNRTVTVKNCFVLGTVTGSKSDYTGAIIGASNYTSTSVSNCYSAAEVTGISAFMNGSANVPNCYFDSEFTICVNESSAARLTPAMRSESNYENWDFETIWTIEEGESYPYLRNLKKPADVYAEGRNIEGDGSQDNPYLIKTAAALNLMRGEPTAWYEIENDIDFGGADWTPVGTAAKSFSGHFLCNGHTISNFQITSTNPYTGFLGYVANAEIEDLTLNDFIVNGTSYVGGLVGYVSGSDTKISNCHTKNATMNGTKYIGGLVGYGDFEEELANCSSNATITATEGIAGGLVGEGSFDLTECTFTGKITSNSPVVGGLVGNFYGGQITRCYSSGEIEGASSVGGLIGNAYSGTIKTSNSFVLGKVESISGNAGGIVGSENDGDITVSCCYNAGKIIGENRTGLASDSSEIICSYYNAESNLLMNDTDADADRLTATLTSKDNYDQWDFENVWAIDENTSYPYLQALEKPDGVNVNDLTMEGNGTEENPYIITNREELELMNYHLGGWFKIANDIDLQNEEWKPIGTKDIAFRGNLDGQEHTISNFTVTSEDGYVGFFATTQSVKISNLNMDNFTVTGNDYTGGLIGKSEGSKAYLYNCQLTNATINGHSYVGGIAGSYEGTMRKCTFSGTVNASGDYCGGAAGYAPGALFDEVDTTGILDTGDDAPSGGITGGGGSTIIASKTDMVIDDDDPYNSEKPQAPISGEKISQGSRDNRVPIRTGDGSGSNPYVIDSIDQLNNIKDYPSSNFVLGKDINGGGVEFGGFGSEGAPFSGSIDGGNHIISNIRIPGSIFKHTDGPTIKNVTIEKAWVNPDEDTDPTSVFVAENEDNTITFIDCHINDTTLNAKSFVGSLVGGSNGKVIIIDCSSNATINADGNYIGGLAGNANAEITRSQFEGGLYATGDYIGGLVGYAAGGSYEESYSSATLNGHDYVGGLVGTKSNDTLTILNCYATGVFTGNTYIGGIIGRSRGTSLFKNVYAAAQMEGTAHVGGIEGDNENVTVTSCYYDMRVSKLDDTTTWGRVTADMLQKSNYVNWNFDDIWHIKEGETYPYLLKEEVPQEVRVNTVSGRIIDSESSEVIKNATIHVRVGENNETGNIIKTVCSDTDGKFTLVNLNYNTITLEIVADGYVTQHETITCNSEQESLGDIGLMKTVSDNTIRARLTWGKEPSDLDVVIDGGGQLIFLPPEYGTGTGVSLDKNDTDGCGPETATFKCDELPQGTYRYTVNWNEGEGTWSASKAKVDIYKGNELIYTITPPDSISDKTNEWEVFDLNSQTGDITLADDEEYEDIDWEDETDSDNDGIPDVYEINEHYTDPEKADTDGDGLLDGYEVMVLGTDSTKKDSDGNGVTDDLEDADGDGLSELEECNSITDPSNEDTDDDGLSDGDEVHKYDTDSQKEDTDGDYVTDADEVKLGLDPLDISDGDTKVRQTLSSDQIELNEDNDEYQLSIDVEASNSIERFMEREVSVYQGMLSDNKAIIGDPVYIAYDAGEITGGTISFELNDRLITGRSHYFPELNLGIERYGICYYDKEVNTIVPVPCSYTNNTIEIDEKYMGDLMIVDYEALMYDLGGTPGTGEDGEQESNRQVDLVLAIDTTGSMGSQISAVKSNLNTLISKLREDGISLYVSIIDYKDITVEGANSTKVNNGSGVDFYNSATDISNVLSNLNATGGGDTEECAIDALGSANELNYRNSSAKYVFLITDAGYKNDNSYELTSMQEVGENLQSKDVITGVITNSSLYTVYSDLTSLTGGENISISGDFCDDMYRVIRSKTPNTNVLLANNIVSGYFKESLTYGSICDTDGDTLTDSDEIDWTNVKKIYEDGTYDLYTWGELCEKSKVAGITASNGAVNALFNSLNKIYVLPGISSPFAADTDKDYYPDEVDEHPLERDEMEVNDEELDDSHLYDEEDGDEDEGILDFGEDIIDEDIVDEENNIPKVFSVKLYAAKSSKKYTDGKIKRYSKDKRVISEEFGREKNKYATFKLTPKNKSYYRVTVSPSSKVKVSVTYKKRVLWWKETKTVKKKKEGNYLLSKGVTYSIKVSWKIKNKYKISVCQDNWAYAPDGGIAKNPCVGLDYIKWRASYNRYKHNYTKTYFTKNTIKSMTRGANWKEYDKDVRQAVLYILHHQYFPLGKAEKKKLKKQMNTISGNLSTFATYAGVLLLFVPAGAGVKVIGYVLTYGGAAATTANLLSSSGNDGALENKCYSSLVKATKNNNFNLCLTQYTQSYYSGQLPSEKKMGWSSWNSGYIYRFAKGTRQELKIVRNMDMYNVSKIVKKK